MADAAPAEFPRYGFSATEPGAPVTDSVTGQPVCNSRLFTSQAELDGAGGSAVWKATPAEAAAPPPPTRTAPAPDDEEETPARRSHR
jgi:hypothetical protein